MAGLYGSQMHRMPSARRAGYPLTRHRALAVVLLAATVTSACSSMTAGTAIPGTTMQLPAGATSTSPGAATTTDEPAPGITVPSTAALPNAASGEPDGAQGTIGDAGIGDPYYPLSGNGGYQIDSYDIDLKYDPDSNALSSTATLTGTVTSDEGLTQFNLDLQPTMTVTGVDVNGTPATFEQQDAELVISPADLVAAQGALVVEVAYAGEPDLIQGGTLARTVVGIARTAAARSSSASRTARRPGTRSTSIRPTPRPSP